MVDYDGIRVCEDHMDCFVMVTDPWGAVMEGGLVKLEGAPWRVLGVIVGGVIHLIEPDAVRSLRDGMLLFVTVTPPPALQDGTLQAVAVTPSPAERRRFVVHGILRA